MDQDIPGDRKWASLQKSVTTSLDKLITGVATPTDVKQMSALISQQSALAGQLFAASVANVQHTAQKRASRVNLSKADSDSDKKDSDNVFREMLASQSLDILGSIRQLFSQQERESHIDQAFDTVRERRRIADTEKFSRPPRDVSGNVTLIKRIKQVEGTDKAAGQQRRSAASKQSVADKVQSLTQKRDEPPAERVQSHTVVASTSQARAVNEQTSVDRVDSTPQQKQVQQALTDNTLLRTRAQIEWDRFNQREHGEDQQEDKRSSNWMRKLKLLMGNRKEKRKNADDGSGSGMWSMLAKTLLLALLHPQLLKTIGDTVAKYLNFDSISTFLADQWENVKSGGAKVVDYIVGKVKSFFSGPTAEEKTAAVPSSSNKASIISNVARDSVIGADVTKERATRMAPLIQKQIDGAQKDLIQAKADVAKNPSQDNKIKLSHKTQRLLILQGQLASYQARANGQAQPAPNTTAISATINALPEDAKPPAAAQTKISSAAVPKGPTPQQVSEAALPATTKIEFDDMPKFSPGQAFNDPNDEVAQQSSSGSGGSGGSFTPININSFGFNSGDDQLNLLNMGLIA